MRKISGFSVREKKIIKRKGIHSKNLSRGKHASNKQYKKSYNRQGR